MPTVHRFDSRDSLSWERSNDRPRPRVRWLRLDLLTTRGRITAGGGLLCLLLAFMLGRPELMALGVGLLCVVLLSMLVLLRTRHHTEIQRLIHTAAPTAGHSTHLTLSCPEPAQIHETLPEPIGWGPQLQAPGSVDYEVVFRERGIHLIGPAQRVLADPLGLIRGMVSTGQLFPVPVRCAPLGGEQPPAVGERNLTGDARHAHSPTTDYYDVATRDYQQGDSVRQVHWKATAHQGKLMVRQENQIATAQALIILDRYLEHWNQAADFRLSIPQGQEPELNSTRRFESALQTICSIGERYAAGGYQVQVRDLAGHDLRHDSAAHGAGTFEAFHAATPSLALEPGNGQAQSPDLLAPALRGALHHHRDEPIFVVLGDLSEAQAHRLAPLALRQRQLHLYLVLSHPERHRRAIDRLADTAWKVHVMDASGHRGQERPS
ncbi:hypothetical protein GCM10027417_18420 [Glutamicibacter endophyticus]